MSVRTLCLVSLTLVSAQESRVSKLLNVFNIVTFPNDPCNNGNVYGSCYTGQMFLDLSFLAKSHLN